MGCNEAEVIFLGCLRISRTDSLPYVYELSVPPGLTLRYVWELSQRKGHEGRDLTGSLIPVAGRHKKMVENVGRVKLFQMIRIWVMKLFVDNIL